MYRLLLFLMLVGCGPIAQPRTLHDASNDTAVTFAGSVLQDFPDAPSSPSCDVAAAAATSDDAHTTDIPLPFPVCVTDNPCMLAQFDPWENRCVFHIVDEIGDVPCDDHNPCTHDDICVNEFCIGVLDRACAKEKGW